MKVCVRCVAVVCNPLKTLMRSVVRSGLRSVRSVYRKPLKNNVRSVAFGARAQTPIPPIGRVPLLGRGHRPLKALRKGKLPVGEVVKFEPTVTTNGGALWPSKPKEIEMGAVTNAAIAKWQEEAGIEPARGDLADMLKRIADLAAELISITALEASGIRDGDGYWHGSDALGGTVLELSDAWQQYDQDQRKLSEGRRLGDIEKAERAFDSVPF